MASSPLPKPPFDLDAAIREVTKGYELSSELHTMLRGVIPRGDGRLESAYQLSKDVQQTLASALSILRPRKAKFRVAPDPLALEISLPWSEVAREEGESKATTCSDEVEVLQAEDVEKKTHRQISRKRSLESGTVISYETTAGCHHCKGNTEKKSSKPRSQRSSHLNSWTTTTSTPFNDGHQWRKYGEKKISHCKMPRCYYRCTHKDDQGCQATKQVQQKDDEDPPVFIVTYNRQHTCKNGSNLQLYEEQFVIEPALTDPCQLGL